MVRVAGEEQAEGCKLLWHAGEYHAPLHHATLQTCYSPDMLLSLYPYSFLCTSGKGENMDITPYSSKYSSKYTSSPPKTGGILAVDKFMQ